MAMLEMSLREFASSNHVALDDILKKDGRFLMGMLNRRDPGSLKNVQGERKKCKTRYKQGTAKRLMRLLHDRLLKHKWGDAAILCIALTGHEWRGPNNHHSVDVSEVLWRMGNHFHMYHPTDRTQTLLANKEIYSFARINQTQLLLEYSLSEMTQGQIERAQHELKLFEFIPRRVAMKRAKVRRKQAIEELKPLMLGSLTMMDYIKWLDRIMDGSSAEEEEEQLKQMGMKIVENIRKVIFTPGNCWDIYLNKLISVLSFYNLTDDDNSSEHTIITDLSKYSHTHLTNPNAHLGLWQFLKKNHPCERHDAKRKIECLRRLQAVDPSNKLCLDLHRLLRRKWRKGGDNQLGTEAYDVIMTMLDYPCWKDDEQAWGVARASLKADRKRLGEGDFDKLLQECWVESGRSTWWPGYHFTNHNHQYLSPAKCAVYKILKLRS